MLGIGDFDKVNRRKVKTRLDQRLYLGKKYRTDPATGYMVCTSGDRKRLHVAMYEAEMGIEVPDGYIVHHKDWNKSNNTIENLVMVSVREHNLIHNPPPVERQTDEEKEIITKLKEAGLL